MAKARAVQSLDLQVLARSLGQIAADLNVVVAALKGVKAKDIDLGPLDGRLRDPFRGQVLVGRQCTGARGLKPRRRRTGAPGR